VLYTEDEKGYGEVSRADERILWPSSWRSRVRWRGRSVRLATAGYMAPPRCVRFDGEKGKLDVSDFPVPTGVNACAVHLVQSGKEEFGVFAHEVDAGMRYSFARWDEAAGAWTAASTIATSGGWHMGPELEILEVQAVAMGDAFVVGVYDCGVVGFENNEVLSRVFVSRGGSQWREVDLGPHQLGERMGLRLAVLPDRNEVVAVYVLAKMNLEGVSREEGPKREIVGIVSARIDLGS
jgi:hypothetical protein